MVPIIFVIFRQFRHILRKNLVWVGILLVSMVVYGTFSEFMLECGAEGSGIHGLVDSLWFTIQTITTVGYGDTPVVTFWGRINALLIMFAGIGVLGFFTAGLASEFIEYSMRKRYGERGVKMRNHVVICNWNPIAEEIVHEVEEEGLEIVLLATLEENPLKKREFVSGTSLHLADLNRVNIMEAKAAVVVAETLDDEQLASAVDAKSVLSIMNIKKINPAVHMVVELLKTDSVESARIAGADEILVRGDIIAKLLAKGVVDPGTIDIMETIITAKSGEEIFEDDIPDWLVGKSYMELLQVMLDRNAIPIALRDRDEHLLVNPAKNHVV
ncbi:MAG TPA: ion channel, partial [Methanomicrobiales archaeon]|nr:ion channel [Methanomicrobiales archaeon]